jgi:hypothetical protein
MEKQTWIDILTDPHHLIADFVMNFAFEFLFLAVLYPFIFKKMVAREIKKIKQ